MGQPGSRVTLAERVAHYAGVFGRRFPNSVPEIVRSADGRDVLRGEWMFGQDYRNRSAFYGSYPGNYLDRLQALFPEHALLPEQLPRGTMVLHAFSGSIAPGPYDRCDVVQESEFKCDVRELPTRVSLPYDFIGADTPYGKKDAKIYASPPPDRRAATRALATVLRLGGHLAWLDTTWPMHRKALLVTVGRIYVVRSTNHRVRLLTLFERSAEPIS